jgi:hypothetical protein
MLHFKDKATFELTLRAQSSKSESEIMLWNQEIGFESMSGLYFKAIEQEEAHVNEFLSSHGEIGNDEIQKIGHSEFVL